MRFLIVVLFLIIGSTTLEAQILGARIGRGWSSISADTLSVQNTNQVDTFQVALESGGRVIHAGLFFRMPIGPVYLELEPMLSAFEYRTRLENLQDWNGGSLMKRERFTSVDLSAGVGFMLWDALRFQGGVTGQLWANYISEVQAFTPEYKNEWDKIVQSYYVGIGLDIVNLTLDFQYENTLNGIGDNITFFGQSYMYNANRQRFTIKLGARIIGVK